MHSLANPVSTKHTTTAKIHTAVVVCFVFYVIVAFNIATEFST